jgi:lysophospholipase L1-like esterase
MATTRLIRDSRFGALQMGLPPKIAFAGDSIAAITAGLSLRSPWFWAQVAVPRLYTFNGKVWDGTVNGAYHVARSGSWSGAVTSHTANNTFASNMPDMNTQLVKDALLAVDPDILFIQVGTNDSTAAYADTIANVQAVVNAVNPRHAILWSILPRTGGSTAASRHTNEIYRRWEQLDPRIHFIDSYPAFLDDTAASNSVVGGSAGGATALTVDGLHPSVLGARMAAADLNRILDRIGVPKANFIATGQASIYNASTAPYDNLLGARGALGGTAGTVGANASGSVADNWGLSTNNAELTVAASKSTMVVDGSTYTAQQLDFTVATTLTASRTCTLTLNGGGFTSPGALKTLISAIVQIIGLKDCNAVELQVAGAVPYISSMGSAVVPAATLAADCIPNGLTETLKYLYPGNGEMNSSGAVNMNLIVRFRQGATAEAKGSIKIAQAGVWAVPDTV